MANPSEMPSAISTGESLWKEYSKIAASGFAIIFLSYFNYLNFNEYAVFGTESLIVLSAVFFLSLLMALLYRAQGVIGRAVLEGLLIFFIVEQNYPNGLIALAAAGLVILLAMVRKKGSLRFLGFAAAIAIVAGIFGLAGKNTADPVQPALTDAAVDAVAVDIPDDDRPPVLLHIILDEHIGVEGLSANDPSPAAMKVELMQFYQDRGFRLYGRAYSEHMHTVNSIPQMLNFGDLQPVPERPKDGTKMHKNAYFDALGAMGYNIHVLQSSFVDYCENIHVSKCRTYGQSSLKLLQQSSLLPVERAKLIALGFVRLSPTAQSIGALYLYATHRLAGKGVRLPNLGLNSEGRLSTVNALLAFDTLVGNLKNARPGDAFFAHMLVPHYPYITTSDCSVKPVGQWILRRSMESRRVRQDNYFDQIRCASSKIDAAVAILKESAGENGFVVIIHGDHGSRITRSDPTTGNISAIRDDDMIAAFSTLFAIHAPGMEQGYEKQAAPVAALLKNFTARQFQSAPVIRPMPEPKVVLDDEGWIPGMHFDLPGDWLETEKTGG